jgi:hypothetical protein
MSNKLRPKNEKSLKIIRAAAQQFFDTLIQEDLQYWPEVFVLLDDVAQDKGYMISAVQRGIFGTTLTFVRKD